MYVRYTYHIVLGDGDAEAVLHADLVALPGRGGVVLGVVLYAAVGPRVLLLAALPLGRHIRQRHVPAPIRGICLMK